jgi:ABC-type multidrug transport system fused ATPase/permease subunit
LKNPKILILDEPTSALDSVSESKITKVLTEMMKNRTVIVIAHRLQTVQHADTIVVLEQGKIVEAGTHQELIRIGGTYSKLVDLQHGIVGE